MSKSVENDEFKSMHAYMELTPVGKALGEDVGLPEGDIVVLEQDSNASITVCRPQVSPKALDATRIELVPS